MLPPTSLKYAFRLPVTATVAVAALAVTAIWWSGQNIDGLLMDAKVWESCQLWRAFTSALPHLDLLHLGFNLYWFWVFGAFVERVYGHLKFAGILLLLALVSSLMDFTFMDGGVGLSGVGYGLWGMLWVLDRRDARFAGTVDNKTNQLFVAWFFICILLTAADVMPVANVAHGAGAITGVFLGLAASSEGMSRKRCIAGLVALVVASVVGSTVLWPWVNLSGYAQEAVEYTGYKALERGDNEKAARLLKASAHMRGATASAWFNLGIAYQRIGRQEDALSAYEQVTRMPDATREMRKTAQEMKDYLESTKGRF